MFLAHGMNIADAAAAPRMHHQWYPDVLQLESGFSPDTIRILRARGHEIRFTPAMSSLQIAMFRDGLFYGLLGPTAAGGQEYRLVTSRGRYSKPNATTALPAAIVTYCLPEAI